MKAAPLHLLVRWESRPAHTPPDSLGSVFTKSPFVSESSPPTGKPAQSADCGTGSCSTQLTSYQRVNIYGTAGRIEIEIPFNAPPDRPCRMWHHQGDTIEEIVLEVCDQYTIQGDLFSQAVLDNTPVPTPLEDVVANMRAIEAVVESGKRGAWVAI